MKLKETSVNYGGLMRCCLSSMFEEMNDDDEVKIGNEAQCKFCKEKAQLKEDRFWHWIENK